MNKIILLLLLISSCTNTTNGDHGEIIPNYRTVILNGVTYESAQIWWEWNRGVGPKLRLTLKPVANERSEVLIDCCDIRKFEIVENSDHQ